MSAAMAFVNGTVHTGDAVVADAAVVVRDGVITEVARTFDAARFPGEIIDLGGRHLAPGFVDLQVNGGGGVLFNDDPSVATVAAIAEAHARFGTTDLLPTFITGPTEGMRLAANAVVDAVAAGTAGVLGVHFEGPVLNPDYAGVHDRALVRAAPADELLATLTSAAPSVPTLVTLAPEAAPAGFVHELCARGAVVAAGHTAAAPAELTAAIDAGLRAGTHVWNGMPPVTSRSPGPVGTLLHDPRVQCGFIADGHHVDFTTLALSVGAAGPWRSFVVSDAMPPVGSADVSFTLGGATVTVDGGRCVTATGTLAGGALPLIAGVRNCVERMGVALPDALRMASLYPARCLGVDARRGRIAPGYPAHLVVVDDSVALAAVVLGGELRRPEPSGRPPGSG
ncbi:MAG TPA: N-acetylglucosamine-6-phosphate deacetylase [Acidimicrobiales bacterium]|nr:N-acetylglucosamine-6-phosphate deacetylase [Acidimicrobiales bacterium]